MAVEECLYTHIKIYKGHYHGLPKKLMLNLASGELIAFGGDVAFGGRVKFHAATSIAFWLEDLRGNWKQAWNKPQFNEGPRASKQFSFPSCKLAKYTHEN